MLELKQILKNNQLKLEKIREYSDPVKLEIEITSLEDLSKRDNFWDNQNLAQSTLKRLSILRKKIDRLTDLEKEKCR